MPVRNRIAEISTEITAWRRDLHAHPELLFDTHRTSAFVAERLRAFGCDEVVEGIGRTGVVGLIRGRSTASGRVIGLRADMDALPIEEATGAPHASRNPGLMHACGHDGHTAMLLGAARYLAESRNFDGTVAVIFQPAEEGGGGGREMVQDGLMERFDIAEVYGMHNWPGLPVGSFAIRPGAFFAATDEFEILIEGKGGHAAKPHETVDPNVIAAHLVLALQTIVARNADPVQPLVVSVTGLHSEGNAFNVIPQRVRMRGTVRSQDAGTRRIAEERLKALAAQVTAAFGAQAEVHFRAGYPVMVNAEEEAGVMARVAERVTGQPTAHAPLVMGGEDFAYMLEARPGAYILVGNGNTAPVHHPAYDFNDAAIPAGASFWAELVEDRLPAA
ncbi:MAG: amidohydrolase [Rhodobacteraceae bacterium]|nr:amidohydrolase [Paracoccaceae bacterium]